MSSYEQPERLVDYLGENGRLLLVLNHTSTSFNQVISTAVGDLYRDEEYHDRFVPVWTEEKPELTKEKIADELKAGDAVLGGGGDGGDNPIISTLVRYPGLSPEQRRAPLISWYGGNANMGPGELVPKIDGKIPSIMWVIKNGWIFDSHPLHILSSHEEPEQQDQPDEVEEPIVDIDELAVYFYGKGATGHGANELHEVRGDPRRETDFGRNKVDGKAAFNGLRKARKNLFSLTETISGEEGEDESIFHPGLYAASLVNGDRMVRALRYPSKLSEDQFFKQMLADRRWPSIAIEGIRNLRRKGSGQLVDGSTEVRMDYETHNGSRLWAQIDGDRRLLAPKGTVTAKQYPKAARLVTTQGL